MSDLLVDAQRGITLNNPLANHVLSVLLNQGAMNEENDSPFKYGRTRTGSDWKRDVATSIQQIDLGGMSAERGEVSHTKMRRAYIQGGASSGDQNLSWHNTRVLPQYKFRFQNDYFHKKEGWEVRNMAYQAAVTVKDFVKIAADMQRWTSSMVAESFICRASGRVGSGAGFQVWYEGENGAYDAAGQDTARQKSAAFQELNTGDVMKQPTEIWSPGTSDFRTTPVAHPSSYGNGDKLSVAFIKKMRTRMVELISPAERGIEYKNPKWRSYPNEYTTLMGGKNRISSGDMAAYSGMAVFTPRVLDAILDDQTWLQSQQHLSLKIGTAAGHFTGVVGDFFGMKLCHMLKMVTYKGGSNGALDINRGLILGANSMLEILQTMKNPPMDYSNHIKQYWKTFADVPVPLNIRFGELQTGLGTSIQATMYYSPVQQRYDLTEAHGPDGYKSPHGAYYKEVGNVIALDAVV